jgi:hypothetical protein
MSGVVRRLVNGDITGGHGLLNFAQNDEAIRQQVVCALRLILGEWFLDVSQGVPWIRNSNSGTKTILGVFPADTSYAEITIKAAILKVDGVKSIDSFSLNFNHNTRAGTCSARITLDSGTPFTLSEQLL